MEDAEWAHPVEMAEEAMQGSATHGETQVVAASVAIVSGLSVMFPREQLERRGLFRTDDRAPRGDK